MPHGMADVSTTVHTPEGTRFNMKCLDYSMDETYFTSIQAEAVHHYLQQDPGDVSPRPDPLPTSTEGTLRLCSLSVVFEPESMHLPMVRVPFAQLQLLEEAPETAKARERAVRKAEKKEKSRRNRSDAGELNYSSGAQAPYVVVLSTRAHFEMKLHGHSCAYPLLRSASTMRILLHGPQARTAAALELLLELWKVHQLGDEDYDGGQAALGAIIASREALVPPIPLDRGDESELLSLRACRVTPFASARGRLTLSSAAIYFQPYVNSPAQGGAGGDGTLRQPWPTLHYCLRRRHISRGQAAPLGLLFGYELYFSHRKSLLVVFDTDAEAEEFRRTLTERVRPVNLLETTAEALQQEWCRGKLSNFDYLVALNLVCGRSFNDLAQYPVMPWVIADYTSSSLDLTDPATFRDLSKPVGALTAERLAVFMERHEEEGWMYGSHYSSPSTVMLFLLRRTPDAFLHLQSGKFGAPDRLFHSVAASWRSSLESHTDVKELVPDFYNTSEEVGEFLVNSEGLALGETQDGCRVDNVVLPPWAANSRDFVAQCRAALESPIATASLPKWIDLLFGCALPYQSPEAHHAANIFYPITYEENLVEMLQNEKEEMMRASYLSQAYEFGRCPSQAFTEPHPQRQRDERATVNGTHAQPASGSVAGAVGLPADTPAANGSAAAVGAASTSEALVSAVVAPAGREHSADILATKLSGNGYASEGTGRLRVSIGRLQSDLKRAASELTAREAEWEKQRTRHRESCGSLARWYREKQHALEGGRWEMSLTTRLNEQTTRHKTSVAQWEGTLSLSLWLRLCVCVCRCQCCAHCTPMLCVSEEKAELVRRLELSEARQRELVVQRERMRQKTTELKRSHTLSARTSSVGSSMAAREAQLH